MPWRKSPPELIARFDRALPDDDACERRTMFGYPAAFVNGNMFTGLHQESFVIRLDEAQRAALRERGGLPFEPMPGRVMREYLTLPEAVVGSPRALRRWMDAAFAYAGTLPPKARRSRPGGAAARGGGRARRPRRN